MAIAPLLETIKPTADLPPSYRYFMIQQHGQGTTQVWGVLHTWGRWAWDVPPRWAFPTNTILFGGTAGGAVRCKVGYAPRRVTSYANLHRRQGYVHLNELLMIPGRAPNTESIQRLYPSVDAAVQKFLFWHLLAQKTS